MNKTQRIMALQRKRAAYEADLQAIADRAAEGWPDPRDGELGETARVGIARVNASIAYAKKSAQQHWPD
jgi:Arc/MetJ family transcription regulator